MWLWQHPSVRKRHAFFLKLGIAIALAHSVILYAIFFSYSHGSRDIMLILRQSTSGAPVRFVSLLDKQAPAKNSAHKSMPSKIGAHKKSGSTNSNKSTKPVIQKTKAQTSLKSTAIKKEPPKAKPVQPKKPAAQTKAPQKAVAKKVAEKKEAPKIVEKKIVQEAKLDAQEEASEELVVAFGAWGTIEQQEVAALYKELSENWRPPAGIAQDCECTVKVHVGWDQTLHELETIKPSGVLMYDVSVRSALQKIALPLWTRGKNLTITFRQ